jgi:hypothetical protein
VPELHISSRLNVCEGPIPSAELQRSASSCIGALKASFQRLLLPKHRPM